MKLVQFSTSCGKPVYILLSDVVAVSSELTPLVAGYPSRRLVYLRGGHKIEVEDSCRNMDLLLTQGNLS